MKMSLAHVQLEFGIPDSNSMERAHQSVFEWFLDQFQDPKSNNKNNNKNNKRVPHQGWLLRIIKEEPTDIIFTSSANAIEDNIYILIHL